MSSLQGPGQAQAREVQRGPRVSQDEAGAVFLRKHASQREHNCIFQPPKRADGPVLALDVRPAVHVLILHSYLLGIATDAPEERRR